MNTDEIDTEDLILFYHYGLLNIKGIELFYARIETDKEKEARINERLRKTAKEDIKPFEN